MNVLKILRTFNPFSAHSDQKEEKEGLIDRVLGGMFWQSIKYVVQTILQLGVSAILARLLEPEQFGLLAVAMVVIQFPTTFSQSGILQFIIRKDDLDQQYIEVSFTLTLLLNLLLACLILLTAPFFSAFFQLEGLTVILRVTTLLYILRALAVIPTALMQRELRFGRLAGIEASSYVFGYALVGSILAATGFGVWALIVATLSQALLNTILSLLVQNHPKRINLNRDIAIELIHYSFGLGIGGVANYLARQGDSLVVGRRLGAEILGYYNRAYGYMSQPTSLFSKTVSQVYFSAMAGVQSEKRRFAMAYRRGTAVTALFGLPASVMLYILGPEIVQVLLGPKWEPATTPLQILALGAYLRLGHTMNSMPAKVTGAVYKVAWVGGGYAILVLVGTWIGSYFGMGGVAFAVLIALAFQFILLTNISLKLVQISWADLLALHVPAAALTAVIGLVSWSLTTALRALGQSAVLILPATALAALACIVLCIRFLPSVFVGRDGTWGLQMLSHRLPATLQSPIRKVLRIPSSNETRTNRGVQNGR